MKNKRFSLSELMIIIIVLSILTAIIFSNIFDFKERAITNEVKSNIHSLQTAVDKYAVDHQGKYPTPIQPTLENPQRIDMNLLYPKYIKNTTKFKQEKYWVDVFGTVWGATEDSPTNLILSNSQLEWKVQPNIKKYHLYEVEKDFATSSLDKSKTKIRLIKEIEVNPNVDRIKVENGHSLLISSIDQYGLESAPVGLGYWGMPLENFTPLYSKEGTFYFELNSEELLYWDSFKTYEYKPEGTSIEYSFAVTDDNQLTGALKEKSLKYGEYTKDFYSLPPAKNIKVKIEMKGANGKNPTLYHLHIGYHYAKENVKRTTLISKENINEEGKIIDYSKPATVIQQVKLDTDSNLEDILFVDPFTHNSPQYEYSTDGFIYIPVKNIEDIPKGSYVRIKRDINPVFITREVNLQNETKSPKEVISPIIEYWKEQGYSLTSIEYSSDGTHFTPVQSIETIPSHTFVSLKFENPSIIGVYKDEIVQLPIVIQSKKSIVVQKENRTASSVTTTQEIQSEWKEIRRLYFLASSGDNQTTHWIRAEIADVQPEMTKITYLYQTSNGYSWSEPVDDISKVSDSRYLKVTAILQMHRDNPHPELEPTVNSIKIINSKGNIDLNTVKPSVLITPVKSNNKNSPFFSTETIINWKYEAFDPKGKDIVEVEWGGDKREKYDTAGTYTVKLRVRNENNYWSDWNTYTFEVKDEKPIAVITPTYQYIPKGKTINWESASIDPDGDGIAKVEWDGDKREVYNEYGQYTVKLRVQDNEGYWSDWLVKTFEVVDEVTGNHLHGGSYHYAVLMKNGTVKTWGLNDKGQLGLGHTNNVFTPTTIPNLSGVKELFVHDNQNFALMRDGTLKAWGENRSYMLGSSSAIVNTPTTISGISDVKKISVNIDYVVALTNSGDLYTWGSNWGGKLGINKPNDYSTKIPTKVLSNIKDFSSDNETVYALDKDGNLYAWGRVWFSTQSYYYVPTKVNGISNVQKIKTNGWTTLAITTDGKLYSWGHNGYGQTGTNSNLTFDNIKQITALNNVVDINIKYSTSYALTQDGKIYVWGYVGLNGQQSNYKYPVQINLPPVKSFGQSEDPWANAVILEDNKVGLWGYNYYGTFANGKYGQYSYHYPFVHNTLLNVQEVFINETRLLGMYLDPQGNVYVAGRNLYGALGTGDTYYDRYALQPTFLLNIYE